MEQNFNNQNNQNKKQRAEQKAEQRTEQETKRFVLIGSVWQDKRLSVWTGVCLA